MGLQTGRLHFHSSPSACRGSWAGVLVLASSLTGPWSGVMGTPCSAITGIPCWQLQSVLLVSWDLGHPREVSRVPPTSSGLSLCNPLIPQDPMNPPFLLSSTMCKAFGLSLLYTQISLGSWPFSRGFLFLSYSLNSSIHTFHFP